MHLEVSSSIHCSVNVLPCAPPPALIVLISYAGTRGRLYCSSPDLYASIAQSSVFCEIGGEYKVTSMQVLLHKYRCRYAAPWIFQQLLMCSNIWIRNHASAWSLFLHLLHCVATKLLLFILDSRCSVPLPFPEHDTLVVLPHLLLLLESDVSYTCQTVWTLAQVPLHSCAAPGIHPSCCPNSSSLHSWWWLPGFTISSTVLCGTWPTLDLLFTGDAHECSHCNWSHHAYFDLLGCTEGKHHSSVN